MSVQHKVDSIIKLQEKEQFLLDKQAAEEERDTMLLELDYKLMLLENGISEGGA